MSAGQPEPIWVSSLSEVVAHAKREIDAGNIGNVLGLMELAGKIGGDAATGMVYENVIRPRLQARWDAWIDDKPGAAELTRDEIRMMFAIAVDKMTPGQAEEMLARLEALKGKTS